ncbi:hypothetical protein EHS25_009559 [Saitozyma podzolica]|uniref:[acyl-carrier-protein] S-malonyltransferase n=1 Tax=Saitozyma podzolica TaxID=1890683 RepID=A0A427YJJ1_9TREE|nr:hypothetical protein EHS25_009559 [Saitozyma podzolica]
MRPSLSLRPCPGVGVGFGSRCTPPPSRQARRSLSSLPRLFPQPPPDPRRRAASTSSAETDWLSWLRKGAALGMGGSGPSASHKALLFAGFGSYPHTPYSPTAASMRVWEEASDAILAPDMTIGYEARGMEEFAGSLRGGGCVRGWMRGWVEGRTLDELMKRPDVTAAFILTSTIAILASAQEQSGSPTLLPEGTTHLAGHGFLGTLTALVAAGRLDLGTGVRLARLYAILPPTPPNTRPSSNRFLTTVLSARHFHSLSSPSMFVPFEDPLAESSDSPQRRKRAMQLILDEIHGLQRGWELDGDEWAGAGIINSSKVLVVTGTTFAVHQIIDRLQQLNLANPVMDVHMPCPYHTRLMDHAVPRFHGILSRCDFRPAPVVDGLSPIILDPQTTHPMRGDPAEALLPSLNNQLRWHKTLYRLYSQPTPAIDEFLSVGRGAKGLGVMLRGELKKRPEGAPPIGIAEFGVKEVDIRGRPRVAAS